VRNGGALRSTNHDWAEDHRGTLKDEPAFAFGEQRLYPCYQVGGNPPFGDDASHIVCAHIVKTPFNIHEKSLYFKRGGLNQADFMCEGGDSFKKAEAG